MEIFNHDSKIDFLRLRTISIGVSIALLLISLGALVTRGLNYALDFTGGVLVEATYQAPPEANAIRDTLEAAGFHNAQVVPFVGTNDVAIRLQLGESGGAKGETGDDLKKMNQVADNVIAALKTKNADVSKKSASFVSASVGEELKSDGIVAVIFVIIGIMIYIGIRFEWRFAIAAIASEFHDTIIVLGFYALTHREFDVNVLASVLAVVGYSINDKVVVFDRVRELFRSARKAEPVEILNKAINSTLSRTIITALFTAITMIALYLFGGPAVHGFALTMVIGILVGTLSSIFFASPILYWLGVSKKDLMPVTRDNSELARRP
ncbi:MAG: protein translocase subunit SecF [Proteobacteria bacterium]|uniref:protein translocase subunit SecF n=1 Tax=Rudaea sp. TaxID=2136325 RepID=UPI001DA31975|nr:protein translocase subunit SecF [Pseudomonadota bacterium]MBS0567778.1 protein translocase subunit SecF [Pseudomonadota bacterium]